MADAMRAMLDELMGKDRDLPAEEREERAKKRHFTEERVCKYFICGFCPHEVFSITKRDMGPCPNEHDKEMKALYESDPKNVTKYGFEDDMARFLRKMIADVNHKVAMGRQRVTRPPPPPNPEMQAKIQEIEDQIQELNVKAELAGEAGNVDEAQGHAAMIETLTAKMLRLQEDAKKDMFGAYKDKEQIVCDVCGAIEDAVVVEARAAADEGAPLLSKAAQDHINGKQHRGFKMIRDWVDEYEKRKLQRLEELERGRDRDRGRGHSDRDAPRRERDRGLSPDRRDRDRYDRRDDYDRRDRDRGRTDRDSGRDRRRSRSRDRYDRRR